MPSPDSRRLPTMIDVAKAAGVSRALVSIVMREAPGASEQTRAHVLATAERLGYVRDARASALRQQGRPAIGVVFQPDQPFQAAMIDHIYSVSHEAGYQVVLSATTASHDEDAALESLIAYRCGSLVVMGIQLDSERLSRLAQRLPVIVVAHVVEAERVECIASDDRGGLSRAVDHLVSLGHRRIHYCGAPAAGGNAQRVQGYQDAMERHGLTQEARVLEGGSREEDGASAATAMLAHGDPPTAVIAFNDACAAGIQDVCVRRGVRIPEDISLVGFDDSEVARISYRQLTTVRQDIDTLADTAIKRAIERMRGSATEVLPLQIIPTTLVERRTTAIPG